MYLVLLWSTRTGRRRRPPSPSSPPSRQPPRRPQLRTARPRSPAGATSWAHLQGQKIARVPMAFSNGLSVAFSNGLSVAFSNRRSLFSGIFTMEFHFCDFWAPRDDVLRGDAARRRLRGPEEAAGLQPGLQGPPCFTVDEFMCLCVYVLNRCLCCCRLFVE